MELNQGALYIADESREVISQAGKGRGRKSGVSRDPLVMYYRDMPQGLLNRETEKVLFEQLQSALIKKTEAQDILSKVLLSRTGNRKLLAELYTRNGKPGAVVDLPRTFHRIWPGKNGRGSSSKIGTLSEAEEKKASKYLRVLFHSDEKKNISPGELKDHIGKLALKPDTVEFLLRSTVQATPDLEIKIKNYRLAERDAKKTRDQLVNKNLRLVVRIAKGFEGRGIALPDLIQEGNIGLMTGIDRFDHEKGFKLSTYATWWIRQAIGRAVANKARIVRRPVHTGETINRIGTVIQRFQQKYGSSPTLEEIVGSLKDSGWRNLSEKEALFVFQSSQEVVSLDEPVGADGGELPLVELMAHPNKSGEHILRDIEAADLGSKLWPVLEGLVEEGVITEKELDVIELRCGKADEDGISMTLKEIGESWGVTRERVRQVEQTALDRLRKPKVRGMLAEIFGIADEGFISKKHTYSFGNIGHQASTDEVGDNNQDGLVHDDSDDGLQLSIEEIREQVRVAALDI